jgi:hypothetical protein
LGQLVLAAILMPVVVLQAEPGGAAGQYPGARAVLADMKRNPHRIGRTIAHMHDQPFARKGLVARRRGADHPPLERPPTQARHLAQERIGRRPRRRSRRATGKKKGGNGDRSAQLRLAPTIVGPT